MDAIGYPDQYHIYSYVENSSGSILDQTYNVNVPPLRCKDLSCVIPSWPPIEVYPGIPKNISISIHPNDLIRFNNLAYGSRYNVSLVQNVTNTHGINLSFSPKMIKLPLNGSNNWQLQITAPGNITSNNYTLMVNEKFIPISGSIGGTTKYHSFNIEVLKPPGLIESVRQFLTPQITFEILLGTTLVVASPLIWYAWKKAQQQNLMGTKNDILQINATVMVGVLILLTLGSTVLKHLNTTEISVITAFIIFPFAVSSIMVVISKAPKDEKDHREPDKVLKLFQASIMAMVVGFVYIITAVITIAFVG